METNDHEEKYIITSALPYINGVKHLGNLIGSLLPADIYARYLRLQGKDIIAICGTDEHGTPAELSALAEEMDVAEYCDKYYRIQSGIYKNFGLSFDWFGRTNTPVHHEQTKKIFLNLKKGGYVYKKKQKQQYCKVDKRFLPDRYVTGICPKCGYEKARGDQCENCTTVHDAVTLVNPKCAICGKGEIEVRESEHYFLRLDKVQEKLEKWLDKKGHWPKTTITIARQWIKDGLRDRCITRDLKWGIPLDEPGMENKVLYVWFDAPIGYISITRDWAILKNKPDAWKRYWLDPETKLIQFLAKDNVPFHTITWPATMMGQNETVPPSEKFVLAHTVKGFQWLNYEEGKFSTSENRGVFTDYALELYPADYWRYYLVAIAPERHDTSFSWEEFQKTVNSDLANTLGNFVQRVSVFVNQHFDGKVPEITTVGDAEKFILAKTKKTAVSVKTTMDDIELQKSLFEIRNLLNEFNRYFQEKAPWKSIKNGNKDDAALALNTSAKLLKAVAILLEPFIPFTAENIYGILGLDKAAVHVETWENISKYASEDYKDLDAHQIAPVGETLFKKISNKEIKSHIQRFGGKEIETAEDKKKKKEAKEKKKQQYKKEQAVKPGYATIDNFLHLGLKTGIIKSVERVPKSDKLVRIIVDTGEDRQLVAGIGEKYEPDSLVGKQIIVVTNLKPRKVFGIKSQGMLLAVQDPVTGELSLLTTDKNQPPGLNVS
ncbi:MAG: methionine--tRNA ligase [Candidatus Hodarchaeales archaeon]|jgi:methionyl-tRNA synthetase